MWVLCVVEKDIERERESNEYSTALQRSINIKHNRIIQILLSYVWFISFIWHPFQSPQECFDLIQRHA